MIRFSRRGRLASVMVGALAATLMAPTAAPAGAATVSTAERAAAPSTQVVMKNEFGKVRSSVDGTFGRAGTVTGTFKPRRFIATNSGGLDAVGVLNAKLTRGSGKVVGNTSERVRIPVMSANGAALAGAADTAGLRTAARAAECDILNLVLGPLDLNLLGLQVSLDTVVLDIIAVTGAGNLLGNLLCAVAGLLDGAGLLAEVSNILNAILAILRL